MQANIPTASTNDVGQKLQSGKIALQEGSKLEMSFLSCKSKKSDMFRSVDKICSGDSWRQPTFPLTGAFTQSLHNLFMSFTMCFGATETRSQLDGLLRSAAKIGYKQHHAWPCLCLIFANLFFVTRYEAAWLAMTFTTCWSYITMFSDSIITQGTWLHKHRNMPFPLPPQHSGACNTRL